MRYADIKPNDIANGEGIVVSLWVQGCPHRCKGCHNPETWDFEGGKQINDFELVDKLIELIDKDGIKRDLAILGGEPLSRKNDNIHHTFIICEEIKRLRPDVKIYIWTGFTYEELTKHGNFTKDMLRNVDVLIDGKFEEDKKDLNLKLRGSSNQRVINVQKTLKENKIILY